MTFTSSPITVKDSAAADKSIIAYNDGTSSAFAHPLLDNTGAIISPATAGNQTAANSKLDSVIANTGTGSVIISTTPTVTAGAYTTGMVVGGKLSLSSAARFAAGSGIIQTVTVSKKTALTAPYDVYFFHTDPTNSTFTDNAALALNVVDIPYLAGVVHCTDLVDNGTPKTLQAHNVALPFKLATGTTLFAVAVIRGAETLASTSALIINVSVLQD